MKSLKRYTSLALLLALSLQLFPHAAYGVESDHSSDPAAALNPDYRPSQNDLEFSRRSETAKNAFRKKKSKEVVAAQEPAPLQISGGVGDSSAPQTALSISEVPNPDYLPPKKDVEFGDRSQRAEKFTFAEIPRDLGGGMKESFWGWGALGFAAGMGITAAVHPFDNDLQNSFSPHAVFGSTGDSVISWTFSPYTLGGVSLLTWIAAANSNHPKLALTCRTLTEALFLSMSIDAIAKVAFRRERPSGGNFSFPSGHATAAFTVAAVLTTLYGWKAALPSYAMASLVSIARVDSDSHFLSDVVMGAVLGSIIGVGTARFQKKKNPNFFLTPQVTRERAALNITFIR